MGIPTIDGIGVETSRPATPVVIENLGSDGQSSIPFLSSNEQSATPEPGALGKVVRLSYEDAELFKQIQARLMEINEWWETIANLLAG